MKPTDDMRFAEIMGTVSAVLSTKLNTQQLDIYFDLLQEYSIEDIEYGAKWILKNRVYTGRFPAPAEFIQAIETRHGSIEEKAEVAWLALIWAMESVGRWASVQFDDPVIHDTVKALGGWLKITDADNPDWNNDKQMTWRRKDFVGLYKIMARQQGGCLQYLIGEQEAANDGVFNDFIPKITRIGGKPGQYQIEQVDRPEQIAHDNDDITKQIGSICKRIVQ